MKKVLLLALFFSATSVQADWWQDTKDFAGAAWQDTKETSIELKDKAVEAWNKENPQNDEQDDERSSGQLSDIKKLADKETYVKAWEDIKESAKNPEDAVVDENGIPTE